MPRGTFQCPCPCGRPLPTHTSTAGPPTLASSFGSIFCWVIAPLFWVLVNAKKFLCPSRLLQSLFPPDLWKSYNQTPLTHKPRFHGDSQLLYQIPRLGRLTWGSEPSQQCENFFGITIIQSVGHPPSGYRIWFYHDCAPPTISLQLLVFGHGSCFYFFFFWWVLAFSWQWLFNS